MCFFFFNDTATTEIYTLSLHDALPISRVGAPAAAVEIGRAESRGADRAWSMFRLDQSCVTFSRTCATAGPGWNIDQARDRKSTRLNSSHTVISYAVFCLKEKRKITCAL